MTEPNIKFSDIEISNLEIYAMIIARDAILEQLLTMLGGEPLATIWQNATGEIDTQIRHGLLDSLARDENGK